MPEENVRDESRLDAAVVDPSDDLLGMNPHAEALSRYILRHTDKLPITIGIQGEWGEGKTTLVNLLGYHLSHTEGVELPVKFVSFSAWPYTTSEKLWRALILKIVRVLYGKDKPEPNQNGRRPAQMEGRPGGMLYAVSRFLSGGYTLSEPPPDQYEEIIRELESTNFGQVSRRKADAQLNEDATMAAVVKGAVAALSTVSPLAAGVRSLFNLDPKDDAARALQRADGGAAGAGVDALEGFRRTFAKIIRRVPEGEPLYIFIDDLDRTQPDVGLDIMEAIRIAFEDDQRCVFIIAVDDRLISEGLWLRYRDLYQDDDKQVQRERFAVRGREYLEKIIQFRMLMPQRTPEQVQKLIAVRYPELAALGDIVREATGTPELPGTNPRRIKQYCEHLIFQKMVDQESAA
jgi:hypothetical protein